MPSGPGALWGRDFERAEVIFPRDTDEDENFSAEYWNYDMSDRSTVRIGGKKRAFRSTYLALSVVAGPWDDVRLRIEGGAEGKKLFDLAHFANLQKGFPHSLHACSIASSRHCLIALQMAALLALFASRYSCLASSVGFLLYFLNALLAFSTNSCISSDHLGLQKSAGFDMGTFWSNISFIQEIKNQLK